MSSLPAVAPVPPAPVVNPEALRRALRRWHSPDLGRSELARGWDAVACRLAEEGRPDGLLTRAEALRSLMRDGLGEMREAGHAELADILERQYARQDALMTIAADLAIGERGFFKRQRQAVETLAAVLSARDAAAPDPAPPEPAGAPLLVSPPPFQAPPLPRWWVGREAELADLMAAIREPGPSGARLAGIVGMGGLGKTSLASRLAHTLADDFPDGVVWLDMAALDLDGALRQLAEAFGIAERGGGERAALAASVRGLLNRRSALVVLDDLQRDEHAAPFLPSTGAAAVIVTSRRADLDLLQGIPVLTLAPLPPPDAARLLEQAIGAERLAGEPEAAASLLARCEHHPLAVDLSARLLARRPHWGLAEFAARLGNARIDTLSWGDERVIERSVDASWRQLDAQRQRFFGGLAAFADRIDPDAAAAVAPAGVDAWTAGEWLEQLADRSLLLRSHEPSYRLHPLVRDVLDRRAAPTEARRALAAYFGARLMTEAARLAGPMSRAAIGWYDAELANIEALRRWALDQPADEPARRLVIDCGSRAYAYFERRTRFDLWRRWSEDGLRQAEAAGSVADRAACRRQLGILSFRSGDIDEAGRLLALARSDFEAAGDEAGLASVAHSELGIAVRRGRWDEARPLGEAGLARAEAAGDPVLAARFHYLLGLAHARVGETEPAMAHHERAAALAEGAGDSVDAGYAHGALAEMCRRVGRLEEGIVHARRAVQVAVELADLRRLSRGRDALGELYLAAGDLDGAAAVYELMVEEATPYADVEPSDLIAALIGHGRVATGRADWERAADALRQAVDLSAAREDPYLEGESLRYLAELHLARGEGGEAAEYAGRAYRLHADHGRTYAAERAREVLGRAKGLGQADGEI